MPEPALSLGSDRLTHDQIDAGGVDLRHGLRAALVREKPIFDDWGFLVGHEPIVHVTKGDQIIARFWKGLLTIDEGALALKNLHRILNRLRANYYGWSLSFSMDKNGGRDKELHFKCRDQKHRVDKHSTPIRL